MAAAFIPEPSTPHPSRKRWTRAECERLESMGIFEGHNYELVDGELIDKMGENQPHTFWLALLHRWLSERFPSRVFQEGEIEVSPDDNLTSAPQPDLVVLRESWEKFRVTAPGPADISLLIEVADTSFAFYTKVKAALYARAGITDYWVVDVITERLIAFRDPADGAYRTMTVCKADQSIAPLAAPTQSLKLTDLFPTEN